MLKKLEWVGSSKKDLMAFPEEVISDIGYALYVAQNGDTYESAKIFKYCGSGVYEIVNDFDRSTFRAVYIVNLNDKVYVLHAFQKKSKSGIKTPQEEIDLIKDRLKRLKLQLSEES